MNVQFILGESKEFYIKIWLTCYYLLYGNPLMAFPLKRWYLRKMRYSNTVACVTSAHVVEQKYIFKRQLAGANEMQGVIRKFTLDISQKEPSQMTAKGSKSERTSIWSKWYSDYESDRRLDRLSKTKESGLDLKSLTVSHKNCVYEKRLRLPLLGVNQNSKWSKRK